MVLIYDVKVQGEKRGFAGLFETHSFYHGETMGSVFLEDVMITDPKSTPKIGPYPVGYFFFVAVNIKVYTNKMRRAMIHPPQPKYRQRVRFKNHYSFRPPNNCKRLTKMLIKSRYRLSAPIVVARSSSPPDMIISRIRCVS